MLANVLNQRWILSTWPLCLELASLFYFSTLILLQNFQAVLGLVWRVIMLIICCCHFTGVTPSIIIMVYASSQAHHSMHCLMTPKWPWDNHHPLRKGNLLLAKLVGFWRLCSFRKYPHSPHGRFLFCTPPPPHPPGKFQFSFILCF